jgi:16S rRNA (cytosine967-C5)-methyltransferase
VVSAQITPARRAAFETVRRTFEDGAWTDRVFAAIAVRDGLEGRELAQARRLAYGAVQRRATSDYVAARLARRGRRADAAAVAGLRLGLFELLFSDAAAEHAAVDQAVELTKGAAASRGAPPGRARAAAGFVNAILRRAASEREELLASLLDDSTPAGAALAHSYPEWLARMWWDELGASEARLLMAAMNEPAETSFRVNTLRADPGAGSALGTIVLPEALVVEAADQGVRMRVATGELVPQSRASQAVVELLDPRPGERVLDLCAGPGIKTTAIAARMQDRGELVSIELDPRRAERVSELCARAGVTFASVRVADAAEADLGAGYDRVLLDPPCSDLGTLASRPDARWRKSPETCERLAKLQRRMLVRAARALAPGGTLVYSTCTVSARENEQVAAELESYAEDVAPDELGDEHPRLAARRDRRFLQILPQRDHTTGFFIARFRRRPS